MRSLIKLSVIALFILFLRCKDSSITFKGEYPESTSFSVINDSPLLIEDAIVVLDVDEIKAKAQDFNPKAFVILADGSELASQANDSDGDNSIDQVLFLVDFAAGEKKNLILRYAKSGEKTREYPKRTQAELSHKVGGQFVNRKYQGGIFQNVLFLRVPPEHTDHSYFIRYEGPGWESEKVGYRFYLDWRNAIDIFGKKVPGMVLQNVGLDGFDSYHEMADWGMDILKVGESLGIGSIGMWFDGKAERVSVTDSTTCEILSNGPVQSQIQTRYYGWKVGEVTYNLSSNLSIAAGSRLTRHTLRVQGTAPNLCTGIVKLDYAKLLHSTDPNGNWMYFASYGKQSLAEDKLRMAVLFRKKDLIRITEDEHSHVVILKPENNSLTYYFLAAWEQEPNGIRSEDEFVKYLEEIVLTLNVALVIEF